MTPGADALAGAVVARAAVAGLRLAAAESLTGGLLAAALVSVPGASRVFTGGVVAYATQLKHTMLGVDGSLLDDVGPVDARVAQQMATGVRAACGVDGVPADLGIATTGVAGPDPDPQTGQFPGTVWLGVSSPAGERAVYLSCEGDRAQVREQTVLAALKELLNELSTLNS